MLLTVITHYIALTDLLLALFVAECTEDTVHTNEHIRTERERERENAHIKITKQKAIISATASYDCKY